MPVWVTADEFLRLSASRVIIDVRSPKEYLGGHIPGAVNVPLFDDTERALIGTLYKKSGQETAIRKGLAIAGPKAPQYLEQAGRAATGKEILVHCWRGGMRSEKMAELFELHGYRTAILEGGYKAYRRHIRQMLGAPWTVFLIGGYTGSGKTELLRAVSLAGEQAVDLEELAHHKGSAFGGLGQPPQPTNEQFENNLYREISWFDPARPLWLEDESRMIGHVTLPDPVLEKINTGILLRIHCDRERRVTRLVREYAACDKELLMESVRKISEKLGGTRTHAALNAIREDDFSTAASLALEYYDKAYDHAIDRRSGQFVVDFELPEMDPGDAANRIIKFSKEILKHGTDIPRL